MPRTEQPRTPAAGEHSGSLAMGTPGSGTGVPKSVISRRIFPGMQQCFSKRNG